jgi:predicted ATP-grasp superfamily ATP-dependent carboligase
LKWLPVKNDSQWLQKSANSCSGLGVRAVDPDRLVSPEEANLFFQKRVRGDSVSAIFVSMGAVDGKSGVTRLLGISRQLVGEPAFGAAEFRYCGSIGPIQLSTRDAQQIKKVGRFLASEYGIAGVWGIDFIVNQNGVWPVDINPRVTASAELLEALILNSASSLNGIVEVALRSCDGQTNGDVLSAELDRVGFAGNAPPFVEGKAVLFNRGDTPVSITSRLFAELRCNFDDRFFATSNLGFSIADVPCAGQTISVGSPILTLRVRCQEIDEAMTVLRHKASELFGLLGIST